MIKKKIWGWRCGGEWGGKCRQLYLNNNQIIFKKEINKKKIIRHSKGETFYNPISAEFLRLGKYMLTTVL